MGLRMGNSRQSIGHRASESIQPVVAAHRGTAGGGSASSARGLRKWFGLSGWAGMVALAFLAVFGISGSMAILALSSNDATSVNAGSREIIFGETIGSGSGITGYSTTDPSVRGTYEYLYFGTQNGKPVLWRVLDDQTNTGSDGLFLLSEYLLEYGETVPFNENYWQNVTGNGWQGSDAQTWAMKFYNSAFTSTEKGYLIKTSKNDNQVTINGNTYQGTSDSSDSKLINEYIFFLSAEEASEETYGFNGTYGAKNRIAYCTGYTNRCSSGSNNSYYWWLRSARNDDAWVASVGADGGIYPTYVSQQNLGVRPALNFDYSDVLFASVENKFSSTKTGSTLVQVNAVNAENTWELTLRDNSRKFTATTSNNDTSVSAEVGSTVAFDYTNATTGSNEYVSAMITTKATGGNYGETLYYGKLAATKNANGTVSLTIPADLEPGEYEILLFSEKDTGKGAGYASTPTKINLTATSKAPETPKVTLSAASNGNGSNVSLTAKWNTVSGVAYAVEFYRDGKSVAKVSGAKGSAMTKVTTAGAYTAKVTATATGTNASSASSSGTSKSLGVYSVTFNANGGVFDAGVVSSVLVAEGEVVSAPSVEPSREIHNFLGWYTSSTSFTNANKWDFGTELSSSVVKSGYTLTLYAGWQIYASPDAPSVVLAAESSGSEATLTATWNAVEQVEGADSTYMVEFYRGSELIASGNNAAGAIGSGVDSVSVACSGDACSAQVNVTSTGDYTAKVTASANTLDSETTTSETTTIYAVTFNANEGTFTAADSNTKTVLVVDGEAVASPQPVPELKDHAVFGWYTSEELTAETLWDFATLITSSVVNASGELTLYADWQRVVFPAPETPKVTVNSVRSDDNNSIVTTITWDVVPEVYGAQSTYAVELYRDGEVVTTVDNSTTTAATLANQDGDGASTPEIVCDGKTCILELTITEAGCYQTQVTASANGMTSEVAASESFGVYAVNFNANDGFFSITSSASTEVTESEAGDQADAEADFQADSQTGANTQIDASDQAADGDAATEANSGEAASETATILSMLLLEGDTVSLLGNAPIRESHVFTGWYTDSETFTSETAWNPETMLSDAALSNVSGADTTHELNLYAGWESVTVADTSGSLAKTGAAIGFALLALAALTACGGILVAKRRRA